MESGGRSAASLAMERYADGDSAAFGALYDALAPRLHAYVRSRLRDAAAVDDVLQHTFLQLHTHAARFQRGARVEPWAYAIARAASIDLMRRNAVRRADQLDDERLESDERAADALLGDEQFSDALRTELSAISPKLREAFLLVRVEGLTHAEAAQVLGIEESTTKVRTHRATHWLREKLERFAGGGRS